MMSISTSCSSHVPFERSGSTWTKFQTQCNLWKRRKTPVLYKLSEASRLNSLFCLCLIPKLSKSMAQPDGCCRLTWAEINGIVASRCVCGDRRASMKLSWFHMMSISTSCSSQVSFERSGSTWTKFQTQCNLWKRKKNTRLIQVIWILKIKQPFRSLSDSQALQINGATGRLLQADMGRDKWHCDVWRPPSLHEIILIPYDVHLHFLLFTSFFWKIWFCLNQIPNSVQPMKTEKNTRLIQVIWRLEIKQPFLSLSDSQALQINGATGLLLQVDTGWDKWHCC